MATYSDIDLKFEPHPVTGDIIRRTDVSAILQSIRNLVLTAEGEFVGELDVGGGVNRLLFKNNTSLLVMNLTSKIRETIVNHEPRAELKDVDILTTVDKKTISAKITFYALNIEEPFVETVRLTRLR